ncbi:MULTISPECIES: peptidylprolyl isomerase [unclassified Sporolactobacillus]|uniref:peptidylprolyl isomerase n=1 Tax=unclassified Sporolactobacillus TaxID=2628533 RepID=UPI002368C576|nr:peptidylprolyl isomerase [Sporolactobacillus sp. CQH2019]MDD9149431.1 peptidylprolyl isomerase [Sporolactobacillus sp. CQH2019]
MKKFIIVLAALLGLSGLAACGNSSLGSAVVVQTKSGNITEQDFYNELKTSSNGSQILQNLVYEKLLSSKYNVSQKEVDAKYNQVLKSFSDKQSFETALSQNGLTDSQFKRNIKDSLMMTKAQQAGIKVTDKDLVDYYNKNKASLTQLKASHILVKDQKTAQSIVQQLKKGGDFAALAKKYSTDTGTNSKGGELGWFQASSMVSEFSTAALKLKVGEISSPVYSKTDGGYHIIKLEGKKDAYNQIKSEVKSAYLTSKEKSQSEVMQTLIKNADVQVKDKSFSNLFNSTTTSSSSTAQ